jgi:hypothetical protein
MDGHAFAATGDPELRIDGFLAAGVTRTVPVPSGAAVKIMTGAIIPPGCDSVVPIEDVEVHEGNLRIRGKITLGMNVRLPLNLLRGFYYSQKYFKYFWLGLWLTKQKPPPKPKTLEFQIDYSDSQLSFYEDAPAWSLFLQKPLLSPCLWPYLSP